MDSIIYGIQIISKPARPSEGGRVLKHLASGEVADFSLGEVYYSENFTGSLKGWKKNLKMKQCFAVPWGAFRFTFFDDRKESPTSGKFFQIVLSSENFQTAIVPANIWYCFHNIGPSTGIIANILDNPYEADVNESAAIEKFKAPYDL